MRNLLFGVCALFCLTLSFAARADAFPGRSVFRDVKTISLSQFSGMYGHVVVVDARSKYEFSTIHVAGAINIPVESPGFDSAIRALRARSAKEIVFYCNGHTCFKSYEAARRAQQDGVHDVVAFDAGIFVWARAHPDHTVLLGRTPIRESEIISDARFDAHKLSDARFQKMAGRGDVIVVDVRSLLQRDGVGLFPFDNEIAAPLSDRAAIDRVIRQARATGKTLLAYDAVGKSVRWFQYDLERHHLSHYYFLRGGANAYYHLLAKEQGSSLAPVLAP